MTQDIGRVAVLNAGGVQGRAIAGALERDGRHVVRVSRSGVGGRAADLGDRAALATALAGAEVAVLTLPLDFTAAAEVFAAQVAGAAAEAGVRRLVFNANTRFPSEPTDCLGFERRRRAVETLRAADVPVTVVEPAIYLDNLLAPGVLSPDAEGGHVLRYPLPATVPVSWTSIADLAAGLAAACAHGQGGETIRPGHSAITGDELAGELAESTGAPVRYEALDPALFEAGLAGVLGADAARGVASQYHWLSGRPASDVMAGVATPPWWPAQDPLRHWVRDVLARPTATS